jgi:hypothetical protein
MPTIKAHKNKTKTFEELTFEEQQKSISIQMLNLGKAIKANRRRSIQDKKPDPTLGHVKNLAKLIVRITTAD